MQGCSVTNPGWSFLLHVVENVDFQSPDCNDLTTSESFDLHYNDYTLDKNDSLIICLNQDNSCLQVIDVGV
jgi:hypothetical protein